MKKQGFLWLLMCVLCMGTMTVYAEEANFLKVNVIKAGDQEISGKTQAEATVLVKFEASEDKETVQADRKGHWQLKVPPQIQLKIGDQVNVTSNSKSNQMSFQSVVVQIPKDIQSGSGDKQKVTLDGNVETITEEDTSQNRVWYFVGGALFVAIILAYAVYSRRKQ
ncbi:Ig-like domain-containing protein [Vaginisenegalia massiliensis]|uniref:Ig-like domain-containing protein n=1 Tax=Vaginisenegalia massiliensis TaxID=2058294 RepID=UPI000F546488|nr:Ig-like domain-containing protein [Vaginisenegalia massiliensis]